MPPIRRIGTVKGNIQVINRGLQQRVLYHDVDKGMPCFGCDSCPGFQFHFWRKLCMHCGCSPSKHDQRGSQSLGVGKLKKGLYEEAAPSTRKSVKFKDEEDVIEPEVQKIDQAVEAMTIEVEEVEEEEVEAVSENNEEEEEEEEEEVHFIRQTPSPMPPPKAKPQPRIFTAPQKYAWFPSELTTDEQVERYFEPFIMSQVPLRGSAGEQFLRVLLLRQIPSHDVDKKSCRGLEEEYYNVFDAFVEDKVTNHSDCGAVIELHEPRKCYHCSEFMDIGDMCIQTELLRDETGDRAVFHRDTCFKCEVCEEPFAELLCFNVSGDNTLVCSRDYNNALKPRCKGCDETIFDEEYFSATNGTHYHPKHFACVQCDKILQDESYILVNTNPCCIECYEDTFASVCEGCGDLISTSDTKITDGKKHGKCWHETCFVCDECHEPLAGRVCIPRNGKLYCREDYQYKFKNMKRKSVRKKPTQRPALSNTPQFEDIWSMAQDF